MKKIIFLSAIILLVLSACRKDVDKVIDTSTTFTPPILEQWEQGETLVEGDVIGFVIDENETPVANAKVSLGNLNTTTDDYGHFFFEEITMNKEGTLVRIEKAGYFNGSRRFFPLADAENRVKIELLDKTFSQSFEASTGETITMNGGAKVDFAANTIVDSEGNSYNGIVNIAAQWMDPSDLRTLDQMPGNLQGVDETTTEVVLSTFGMIAVELEGANGQALNIADGQTATVSMPVPASLQGVAPAEIPLWSYNEQYGVWAEESKATLVNGVYVGEVSHFSFWNCDVPFPLIQLDFRLVDEEGVPIVNHRVSLTPPTGWSASGYSTNNGDVSGKVPADKELVMAVYNECGEVVYTQTLGPFNVDTSLGDIVVNGTEINSTVVRGNLLDCVGSPVTNGLIIVYFNNQIQYEYIDAPSFEIRLNTCQSTTDIEVRVIDFNNAQESQLITSNTNGQFDLGDIDVCGQQDTEYLTITVDGVTATYFKVALYKDVRSGGTGIDLNVINSNSSLFYYGYFAFNGVNVGSYGGTKNFVDVILDETRQWQLEADDPVQGGFETFNVTEFGPNIGDFVAGNFSGTIPNKHAGGNVDVMVSGEFRIRRQ